MTDHISALLAQYHRHNARGSLLAANQTMASIVEALAALLDRPYQCACGKPVQPVSRSEPEPEPVQAMTPTDDGRTEPKPDSPLIICSNCGKPTYRCECSKTMPQAVKDDLTIPPPPIKRGPGRPRKHPA
jgi:hypothetical protein